MKDILNKLGIIVENVEAKSSKNIWKVFVGGKVLPPSQAGLGESKC